jgi:hypothetical protein
VTAPAHLSFSALDLRRAILGHLLVTRSPVTVADVIAALSSDFGPAGITSKRVADVLRYQVGRGRVRRVDRGVYQAVPEAIPKATAWRCVNWRRAAAYASDRARREAAARDAAQRSHAVERAEREAAARAAAPPWPCSLSA